MSIEAATYTTTRHDHHMTGHITPPPPCHAIHQVPTTLSHSSLPHHYHYATFYSRSLLTPQYNLHQSSPHTRHHYRHAIHQFASTILHHPASTYVLYLHQLNSDVLHHLILCSHSYSIFSATLLPHILYYSPRSPHCALLATRSLILEHSRPLPLRHPASSGS